ncbi:hypothetical protein [Dapis sp. BLCC M229]|uniref:hypothetical protein n=1 Tax=Dapis sp. BLCC M229 TaxID=3400188 RepID=UPI003CEE9402
MDQIDTTGIDNIQESLENIKLLTETVSKFGTLAEPLAILETSLGKVIDLGNQVQENIIKPIDDYFSAEPNDTTEELIDRLNNLVPNIDNAQFDSGLNLLTFDLSLSPTQTQSINLNGGDFQLGFDGETQIDLTTGLDFKATVGLDLNNQQNSFIDINKLLGTASVDNTNSPLNADLDVGFLGASIQGGTVDLDASIEATFNDPGGNGNKITLSELEIAESDSEKQIQNLQDLVNLSSTGTILANLPVEVKSGDVVLGSTPSQPVDITLGDGTTNFFETAPQLQLPGDKLWTDFTNITAKDFIGIVRQLGSWLDQLRQSDIYGIEIPFIDNKTLGDLLDIGTGLENSFVSKLIDKEKIQLDPDDPNSKKVDQEILKFASVQELTTLLEEILPGTNINAQYDKTSGELTFDLTLSPFEGSEDVELPLDFDLNLEPVGNISSEANVTVTPTGTLNLTFGIDLDKLTQNLTVDTELSDLNNGNGIFNADGQNDIEIKVQDGNFFQVNLDSANTIGDVINAINTAAAGQVIAKIDPNKNRIILEDQTSGDKELTVKSINSSGAAFVLGILGTDSSDSTEEPPVQDGIIEGQLIDTRSFGESIFIDNTSLEAGVDINGNFEAAANLGLLEIEVNDGQANINSSVNLALGETTGDNRLTIDELYNAIDNNVNQIITNQDIAGTATLNLENITLPNNSLNIPIGDDASITVEIEDITQPIDPQVTVEGFENIFDNLSELDFSTVVAYLTDAVGFLGNLADENNFPLLNEEIPLINLSINDVLDYSDRFADIIDQVSENPTNTIETLESVIQEALGEISGNSEVDLSLIDDVLRVDLQLEADFEDNLGLNIDLQDLTKSAGIDLPEAITNLIGVGASAQLNLKANAGYQIALGFDLSQDNPQPFLFEGKPEEGGTGLILEAKASADNLDFTANVGPLNLSVENGTASIADPDGNPITFTVNLKNSDDGRLYLGTETIDFEADLGQATAKANLPIDLSLSTTTDPLEIVIDDLEGLLLGTSTLTTDNFTLPDFSNLLELPDFSISNLLKNPDTLINGIDSLLATLQDGLNGEILGVSLPIVGDALAETEASQFIEDFREDVLEELRRQINNAGDNVIEVVQKALFDVFGASGLGLLQDGDGQSGITLEDILVIETDDDIQFDMNLGQNTNFEIPAGFDIGIPALNLDVDANVDVDLDWNLDFGFGINEDQGFYFNTSDEDELEVTLKAGLKSDTEGQPATATGKLAFLQVDVTDQESQLGGKFTIDIQDPNSDNQLTLNELVSGGSLSNLFDTDLKGLDGQENPGANVDLDLKVSFEGDANFPQLESNFKLDWEFAPEGSQSLANSVQNSSPDVGFYDIQLDMGSFLNDFATPILGKIQEVTDPLEPVINFIDAPIPLISEFAGDVDLLDLAKFSGYVDPKVIDTARNFIGAVNRINELLDAEDSGKVSFGDFVLTGDDSQLDDLDLSDPNAALPNLQDLQLDLPAPTFTAGTPEFVTKAEQQPGGGLEFPILEDPASVFGLFLGQDADLFTYDMPTFDFTFGYSQPFRVLGVIKFTIGGSLGAKLDYDFGYDTFGLRKFAEGGSFANVFDGFFLDDLDKDGVDKPETVLTARLFAEGGLDAFILGGGVGGGLTGTVNLDLNDVNDDGKVRATEIAQLFECAEHQGNQLGKLAYLFEIEGDITLDFYAFVETFFSRKTFEIAEFELFEFELSHPDCFPILAEDLGGGVLRLNMGDAAPDRLFRDTTDGSESFIVSSQQGNEVTVDANLPSFDNATGDYETATNLSKILANGAKENDSVTINVDVNAELSGGDGNDVLTGGGGQDTINGNSGNDTLQGNGNSDVISGDAGNDDINGGAGEDIVDGGLGNDIVAGGTDNDTVSGGEGDDQLLGEAGDDFFETEAGNDNIDGGDDTDLIDYQEATQAVVVNLDDSKDYQNSGGIGDLEDSFQIDAATAKDGLGGEDQIFNVENVIGSEFDDVIIGNASDNEITALNGNDLVIGNAGNDTVDGGNGGNVVSYRRDPSSVNVSLEVGEATDGWGDTDALSNIENVVGSEFDDEITGNVEKNIITAGGGDDTVNGREGNDELFGEADNDLLKGEQGNDFIDGGGDNDTVIYDNSPNGVVVNIDEQQDYQNPGGYQHTTIVTEKSIPTDTEPDFTIEEGTAQDGFDTEDILTNLENIIGSEFNDVLIGNEKDNSIEGLAGNDIMVGNAGDDTLDGGNDNDTASYRRDPDKVNVNLEQNQANDGFGNTDQILNTENVIGSDFDDTITGDEVDNIIHSGTGNDIVEARDGEDIIFGEDGTDDIKGEDGNDFIVGGKDPDKLDGGNDNDTASYFTSEKRVHVSLYDGKGWAGDAKKDTLTNIENLEGSEYEDLLIGDAQNNILSGLGGDDLLKAKRGNDLIDGGEGNDRLYGQDGNDTLEGQAGNDLLKGGQDHDQLDGGEGNDNLHGQTGKDTLEGGAGNDNLKGGAGDDQLDGEAGNDNLSGEIGDDNLKGGEGNDQLDGGDGDDNLSGEAGDDQLYGWGGQDSLDGGTDDDLLEGRSGNDQLEGGEGNDRIYGNQGNDYLSGGDGNDLLKGGFDKDTLEGGSGNDELFGQIDKDLLKGGEGNDNLWGGGNSDRIYGEEGNDYLNGEVGNDTLEGNEGNDRLYGEDGDDELKGNTGRDYLDGGAGNDELQGNEDNDRIYGREGDDILEGGTGQDILDGGADDDFMYGEEGSDRLSGDSGDDYLDGGEGSDRLKGETGDDHLLGQSGRDYLDGGKGEDILEGGEEADLLLGKEGDDYLEGGDGDDELDGGADEDQLYGQEGNDTQTGGKGNDYLEGGEGDDELAGGEGNDQLYGQEGKDKLSGEDGNDNLYGGDDDDQLDGGKGNDLLSGEEGNDTLDSGDGDDNLEGGDGDDELTAGKGEDQLYGEGGNDTLDAGVGHDYIEGGEGDDEITAGKGEDQAYGGTGNDNINGNEGNDLLDGEEGDDVIEGEDGDDYIIGGEGDDELNAGEGNDLLEGGEGNDSLHGNEGDNILDGGKGDDELYAGSGSDTFVLQQGGGFDSVYNFQVDDDFFELIDLTFEELEISEETESNDNAVISVLDSGEQLAFVEGVKADELTGFHFFPFGGDEVEEETDEEETEIAVDAETDQTVVESEDITSDSESQENDESDENVLEEEDVTSESEETDETVTEEEDVTSESEETEETVTEEEDITSESESEETDELDENVVEENIASDAESPETDETVVEEEDITSDSESPETDETVVEEEDITSEEETDDSDNSITEEEDVTSESPETDNETVAESEDITSDAESPETDESDNSVAELEAIASNSPKDKETDIITGEEVSTETEDELLNGVSELSLDNTDEFLLAGDGDNLASIPEIEVKELTTSDNNIEDNITTGSSTIETADNDSQDPVLAAIDTNEALI